MCCQESEREKETSWTKVKFPSPGKNGSSKEDLSSVIEKQNHILAHLSLWPGRWKFTAKSFDPTVSWKVSDVKADEEVEQVWSRKAKPRKIVGFAIYCKASFILLLSRKHPQDLGYCVCGKKRQHLLKERIGGRPKQTMTGLPATFVVIYQSSSFLFPLWRRYFFFLSFCKLLASYCWNFNWVRKYK